MKVEYGIISSRIMKNLYNNIEAVCSSSRYISSYDIRHSVGLIATIRYGNPELFKLKK